MAKINNEEAGGNHYILVDFNFIFIIVVMNTHQLLPLYSDVQLFNIDYALDLSSEPMIITTGSHAALL